ncbi:hypothetical protein M9458_021129, partial [Cirrhinus mrigala]
YEGLETSTKHPGTDRQHIDPSDEPQAVLERPAADGQRRQGPFACGEMICDFHGRLISRDEGLEVHQNNRAQAGHLFFFTSKNGQDMCLDAHEERCDCHPNKATLGRHIKHSAKRANLSPRLHFVEDEPLILFMATRDIQTGEEIRYDYGDNKRSYAGDGLDLTPS